MNASNFLSVEKIEIKFRKSNQVELINHFQKVELEEAQSRIQENIQLQRRKKSNNQSNNILSCLKNHFIFYNLSHTELQNVKQKMFHCKIKENQRLYTFHDFGTCFFIIIKGRIEIRTFDKEKKNILKSNDGFGELALLYNTQRNSQAFALEETELWAIDRVTFRHAVEEVIVREYTENKKCFQSVRFFSTLSPNQKDIIASSLIKQKFYKGQAIIQEGDPGSTFYYIKEGNASVYKASKFQRKLTKGDSFGEQSLYYNTMRQYTIKADQDVVCLILGRDTLHKTMGQNIYEVTFKNFIKWAFQKNQIISQFTKQTQQNIINEMKISSFKAQESIFKRGVIGFQKIVVVIEGTLKKLKSGNIVATKGQCYGEQFLKDQNKILDDEIIMQNYGVIAQISQQDFNEAVQGQKYNDLVVRKKQESELSIKKMQTRNTIKLALQKVDLRQFQVVAQLSSQGQFGPLYILQHQQKEYLLKVISKKMIEQYQVFQFAVDQSRVLDQLSCPFVVSMGRKFQTFNYICYISQLVRGEDLYDILKTIGLLSTEDSQFYTASIILILEYFAEKSVICRDIKPENFMVDHQGYLKLINLPTAKILQKDTFGNMKKTFTIIGTPHYMAPDIVIGKGYNNLVDLWSLGICVYEFLCGVLPFGDSSEDAYEIYEEIMQSEINFPQFFHDKKAKKLIEQLLSHNPSQRHSGSFENLKRHSWFDDFDWGALLEKRNKSLSPPIVPKNKEISRQKINISLIDLMKQKQSQQSQSFYESKWDSFVKLIQPQDQLQQ